MDEAGADLGRALSRGSLVGVGAGVVCAIACAYLVTEEALARPSGGDAGLLFPYIAFAGGLIGAVAGELTALLSVAGAWALTRRTRGTQARRLSAIGALVGAAVGGGLSVAGLALLGPVASYALGLVTVGVLVLSFTVWFGIRRHSFVGD